MTPMMPITLDPRALRFGYCPFYCEENAWHLAAERSLGPGERDVVVVSNEGRSVAMWQQRSAVRSGDAVVWDYHVFVVAHGRAGARVWDFDCALGLDVDALGYLEASFRRAPESYAPRFRVIPAAVYHREFASDRSHMRGPNGRFLQPPPPWPAIGRGHTLDRFVDMRDTAPGRVLDLTELYREWASCSRPMKTFRPNRG